MKNTLLILLFLLAFGIHAQQKKIIVTKTDSLQVHGDACIGKDALGSWYFISDNALIKKHKEKDWQYKNPALGKIAKVDLQNPLKIVLFYENFNTVLILDNQLNEIKKIDLSKNDIPVTASAVGLAFGNQLWIFNVLTQRVGLLDYLKNDYREITVPFKGNVAYYTSDFNYFQWIDDQSDWYRSDVYGKVNVLGKVPLHEDIQLVSDKGLIYKNKDGLFYFSFNGNTSSLIDVDKKTFESFLYKDQILSIFTKQGITNYKITLP